MRPVIFSMKGKVSMAKTFINLTNHPSAKWGIEQLTAAGQYGHIVDIPFPAVDPEASSAAIGNMADTCIENIREYEEPVVLVQGEFTLVFAIVTRLKMMGIRAFAACSERAVEEQVSEDGVARKSVVFRFCGFREYA